MTEVLRSIFGIYLLFGFALYLAYYPAPLWRAVAKIIPSLFDATLKPVARWSLFRHLFSLVAYAPIGLLLLPIDFLIACVTRRLSPSRYPVFICGTPRSGSTLLHRLLINSSHQFYGLTHFEWRYPSLTIQVIAHLTGVKRIASTRNYWSGSPVEQLVSKMHPNRLGDYEEDAILFEERCGHHPYQFLHLPKRRLNFAFSQEPTETSSKKLERFYSFIISSLSLLKPPNSHFLSKEVASNERLPSLSKRFSSSKFIVITRRPQDYLASLKPLLDLSTLSKTCSRAHLEDPEWWPTWYEWLVEQANMVARFYATFSLSSPKRICHVRFEDLLSDPRSEILRILDFCDLPPSPEFELMISQHISSQQSRERGYNYNQEDCAPLDYDLFSRVFYD
ncbi:sulfotransferase [Cyanobium sp. Aljojuca 7D2]|uniref:sulfotransferase family protein n=1 Tax=Cyanobium sp. Aljojuca 7D2 TaxID=2823698 RepID=UPI0020CE5A7F|nr:sulfotransferase [Cyanobium sp. Aljojuca 7D2]MCP9892152.1 sulfotransferase [Cyanobium sp. Aljojuca 7D2]